MKPIIRINGKPAEPQAGADLVEVEPGVYSLILDGCSYEAEVTGSEIDIDGVRMLDGGGKIRAKWNPAGVCAQSSTGRRPSKKAPMPGKVVQIPGSGG